MSRLHEVILAGGNARDVESVLREYGPPCTCQIDANGELPLHSAAKFGQAGTVRRLLRCGADVNARTACGTNMTALHLAAFYGHVDVVEALLSMGALPTIADVHDRTPAHCAEEAGNLDLANLLHTRRREMGAYEIGDIAHMATKGLDVAAEGVQSLWSSFNRFASSAEDPQLEPRPKMAVSRPQPANQPPACSVDPLAARVQSIGQASKSGHLKEALGWQDELTKVALALDNLELGGDTAARAKRREVIARIEEIGNHVDERLKVLAEELVTSARAIAQVEQGISTSELQSSQHSAEWRTKLIKIASSLDALQCATEPQRTERKALLARVDAAEEKLKKRELQA
mmetsp:Transcript_69886/g.138316  ORF Transcript_69886/g.138316 Transcript_69886/m.138316 type:complete len:345 (-) Transcript_69886:34-1068(-)